MILQLLMGLKEDVPVDFVPQYKVQPGGKVVGVVGVHAQRLYSILHRHITLLLAKKDQLKDKSISVNKMQSIVNEIQIELYRGELIKEIFWTEVREECGVPDAELVICEGWQVVEPATKLSLLDEFLRRDCGDPGCPVHSKNKK